jgi:hypothetical protein
MTQNEATKLALDALELVNIEFVCNGAHHAKKDRHGLDEDCPVTMRYRKAIAALKAQLADPMREVQRLGQEIEQEPVGMVKDLFTSTAWERLDLRGSTKVYLATPPQRKPLTEEQIFALENSIPDEIVSDRDWCIHFARAIEAAHGIKENQ